MPYTPLTVHARMKQFDSAGKGGGGGGGGGGGRLGHVPLVPCAGSATAMHYTLNHYE